MKRLLMAIALVSLEAGAESEIVDGVTWYYETFSGESDTCARIVAGNERYAGDLTIPPSLGGCPVTSVGSTSFYGHKDLTSVTIPACVAKLSQTFPSAYRVIREVVVDEGVIRPVKPSQDYISAALVEVEVGGAAGESDAASAPGTTVRESVVSLNGDGWRFRREDTGTEDFSRPGLDVSGWSAVRVPHDWAIAGPFDPKGDGTTGKLPWRGVGWYRRDFALSSADEATLARGGRAYLELDGVMANPRVWVNGILAGRGDYGYLGLVLDVTEHLRRGRNELAVAADTRRKTARWYPGAGIYRDVTLRVCPPQHVIPNTMYVTTPFVSATAAVVRLEYALPRDGVRGSGSVCPLYTNEEFTVRNPRLWCPEDPHLYAVERFGRTFRYGIRTAEFTRDDGFHLNGRRV